jgi:fructose-bisphosphate aldolase, class I
VGIKVDQGLENYEGSELEQVSLGLETLPVRLAEYKSQGALFTKWRTVYKISDSTPSESILNANATTLSEYARMVIDSGMVPIVEPEVLMDGTHDINKDRQVTYMVLKSLFQKMSEYQIDFSKVLQEVLPDNLGGVAFLSGGIQSDLAIESLRQINLRKTSHIRMTFSFARALQESFLSVWKGEESNIISARAAFDEKLGKVSLAVTIYT